MLKTLTILMIIICVAYSALGQKNKSAAASSTNAPANSSGPASTTGSQQTGYVYRLSWRYHVKYASVNRRVDSSAVGSGPSKGNVDTITQRVILRHLTKGIGTVEIHQEHDKAPPGVFEDTDSIYTNPAKPPADRTGYTLTNVGIDSVSRYWDRPPKHFKRHRLKVSVTQGDSGKLQVGMFENRFLTQQKHFKEKFIDFTYIIRGRDTTPDYAVPIGANDSAQNFYLQIDNKLIVSQPIAYISLRYALTQYGAMVIPYKYRFPPANTSIYVKNPQATRFARDTVVPAPSESSGNINLAFYLGRKWGWTRFYFDPTKTHNTLAFMASGFLGASLVPLSVTTVKYPKDADSLPSQAIAFSLGAALSLEWRGIDLGVFTGADFTSGKYDWIYNRRLWVGFGIGVNLGMFASGPSQFQL